MNESTLMKDCFTMLLYARYVPTCSIPMLRDSPIYAPLIIQIFTSIRNNIPQEDAELSWKSDVELSKTDMSNPTSVRHG